MTVSVNVNEALEMRRHSLRVHDDRNGTERDRAAGTAWTAGATELRHGDSYKGMREISYAGTGNLERFTMQTDITESSVL
jgi:hypothetical protein